MRPCLRRLLAISALIILTAHRAPAPISEITPPPHRPPPNSAAKAAPETKKIFAGVWQGKEHVTRKNSDGTQKDEYEVAGGLTVSNSETEISGTGLTNMKVTREGRTIAYVGLFTGTDGQKSNIDGTLTVHPSGSTATFESHQRFTDGRTAHYVGVFKKTK